MDIALIQIAKQNNVVTKKQSSRQQIADWKSSRVNSEIESSRLEKKINFNQTQVATSTRPLLITIVTAIAISKKAVLAIEQKTRTTRPAPRRQTGSATTPTTTNKERSTVKSRLRQRVLRTITQQKQLQQYHHHHHPKHDHPLTFEVW
jgi:hypothetical protein